MKTPLTDVEYEEFVENTINGDWSATRDTDPLYDIAITSSEHEREILIDSARNRISMRNAESGEWGLQQEPVQDIEYSTSILMGAGMQVRLNEMHYLGITKQQAQQVESI